jgi:GntR family transcriptional regulator
MDREEVFRFRLNPGDGTPIYRQIIRQVETAVLGGRLRPGDRLPTIRALAVELKTNPNTIARAYGEMEIRGIVATQVGNGTFISDQLPEPGEKPLEEARQQKIRELTREYIAEMRALGVAKEEILAYVKGENK